MLPALCLLMIVKNEAHVIRETLECMSKHIDYWVICDTGSTDDTEEVVRSFFREKNIPGEYFHDEWKHFGHNRTLAFQRAYKKTQYVWVMDADDLLVGELTLPDQLTYDGYVMQIGDTDCRYHRIQIFNNQLEWEYVGVLHEYARCKTREPALCKVTGDYYIDSRRLGDRNKNPLKYLRDAQLLLSYVENEPDLELKARYYFYIGQSFKDYGDFERAQKYFLKRLSLAKSKTGETYLCHLHIAHGLTCLDFQKHYRTIVEHLLRAYQVCSQRAEAPFQLTNAYLQKKCYEKAFETLKLCKDLPIPKQELNMVEADVYLYDIPALYIRICHLLGKSNEEREAWDRLLKTNRGHKLWKLLDIRRFPIGFELLQKSVLYPKSILEQKVIKDFELLYYEPIGVDTFKNCARDWMFIDRFLKVSSTALPAFKGSFRLVVPKGWVFIQNGFLLENALLEFKKNKHLRRVYMNPENQECGLFEENWPDAPLPPYLEKNIRATQDMFWEKTHCVFVPYTRAESVWLGDPHKTVHFGMREGTSLLNEFLTSFFLFCLCREQNYSFVFSMVPYRGQVPFSLPWTSREEVLRDILFHYFGAGPKWDFSLFDREVLPQYFQSYQKMLHNVPEDYALKKIVCAPSFILDETCLQKDMFSLQLLLIFWFRVPFSQKEEFSGTPFLPFHKYVPDKIFTDPRLLSPFEVQTTQEENQILSNLSIVRVVQGPQRQKPVQGFTVYIEGPFLLTRPILSWVPEFVNCILNLSFLPDWKTIYLEETGTPCFRIENHEAREGGTYTYPLFHKAVAGGPVPEYFFLKNLHFIDCEIFYHPNVEKGLLYPHDAYNKYGFKKQFRFPDPQYFEYDPQYEGDFVKSTTFNLSGRIEGWPQKSWGHVHMDIPRIEKTSLPLYCVNLKRRLDRRRSMEQKFREGQCLQCLHFVEAIDGREYATLFPDPQEMMNLFLGNEYGYQRGVMGCALSHVKLWEALVDDPNHEHYIIIEDDIEFDRSFPYYSDIEASLVLIQNKLKDLPTWDVLMLGYSRWEDAEPRRSHSIEISPLSREYIGGTFGYVIHKKAALFLLQVIRYTGLHCAIDNLWVQYYFTKPFMKFYQLSSDLVRTPWLKPTDTRGSVDTDIQGDPHQIIFHDKSHFLRFYDVSFSTHRDPREWRSLNQFFDVVANVDRYVAFETGSLFYDVGPEDLMVAPGASVFVMTDKFVVRAVGSRTTTLPSFSSPGTIWANPYFRVEGATNEQLQTICSIVPNAVAYTQEGQILREGRDQQWMNAVVLKE